MNVGGRRPLQKAEVTVAGGDGSAFTYTNSAIETSAAAAVGAARGRRGEKMPIEAKRTRGEMGKIRKREMLWRGRLWWWGTVSYRHKRKIGRRL